MSYHAPHAHAAVDRHRLDRRVRKNEADCRRGQPDFGHDRREVVAVGAQPVQPDDARRRVLSGFDFDCVEELGHRDRLNPLSA